jgi:hypothetical protein
MMTW